MSLSKTQIIVGLLGTIAVCIAYLMALQKDVSDLKADKKDRSEEIAQFKTDMAKKIRDFEKNTSKLLEEKISSLNKKEDELVKIAYLLEKKHNIKNKISAGKFLDKGVIDFDNKKYYESIENLIKSIELNPDNSLAYYYISRAYQLTEQKNSAMSHIDHALKITPRDDRYLHKKGELLAIAGKHEEAIPFYEEVLEIDPNKMGTLSSLVVAYKETERFNEALKTVNLYMKGVNYHSYSYFLRGQVYFKMGDCDKSTSDFKKTLELEKKVGTAYYTKSSDNYINRCS